MKDDYPTGKMDVQNQDDGFGKTSKTPFSTTDYLIGDDGSIYHIQTKSGQIAPDILLVGDPGRARFIGEKFLRDIEVENEHRGLVTITGTCDFSGERTTVLSPLKIPAATSGIGTPSLEIVINELVALNEIDFETRTRRPSFPRLHIIRVGTSGGLQPGTKLGTPIITTYAIGLDNSGFYYEAPYLDEVSERLEGEIAELFRRNMNANSRFYGKIHPYVTRSNPTLVQALLDASAELDIPVKAGLTASAPGFFAPQGRDVNRIKPSILDLDEVLSGYDPGLGGQRVENMEMEASFLIHYLGGIGFWAGAICPAIANRRKETFDIHYQYSIENAARIALLALARLRSQVQVSK